MQFDPSTPEPMSPRAQMLSGDLARAVQDFQRRYPDTTDREVHQALRILGSAGVRRPSPFSVALVLGLAVALGAGALSLILGRSAVGWSEVMLVGGAVGLLASVSLLLTLARR